MPLSVSPTFLEYKHIADKNLGSQIMVHLQLAPVSASMETET